MAFAYDSAIAMAHGLHSLLGKGLSPENITAGRLSQAMRQSTFRGASGRVSFYDNGDSRVEDLEYIVYNHDGRKFQDVGIMKNGVFAPCQGVNCSHTVFSDGSSSIPNVQRSVRDACNCLRAACHDIVSPPLIFLCTCADLNERLFVFVIETEDWLLGNAL